MGEFTREHNKYKYCPVCYRGNGTAVFLEENAYVEFQDTLLCYECLCYMKTMFINKYPGTKSRNYVHFTEEELEFWSAFVKECRIKSLGHE